ncbi:MAG TPA: hypothetical protein DD438_11475 [Verrucomicrobiales bacterium]|nr:hypothetical protein [Verrucomicrobiales bacterium]HCQ37517.1 hypothetical protein [Verrucomicrobiales bacterium]
MHVESPILGFYGIRLGISYPGVTALQVEATLEATA